MSLQDFYSLLPEKKQYELSIKLLQISIPIWNDFSNKKTNLEYVDTVVGMEHKVAKDIIQRTLDVALKEISKPKSKTIEITNLKNEYRDPIVSLQDWDWEIPESVQLIFYSANNLIESLSGKKETFNGETMIYISANQSIDAITREKIKTFSEINSFLKENK